MALGKVTSRITFESVIDPYQGEFIKIRMDDEIRNYHVERTLGSSSGFLRDNLELVMKNCLSNMVVELEKYRTIHNILFNELKRWCNEDMGKDFQVEQTTGIKSMVTATEISKQTAEESIKKAMNIMYGIRNRSAIESCMNFDRCYPAMLLTEKGYCNLSITSAKITRSYIELDRLSLDGFITTCPANDSMMTEMWRRAHVMGGKTFMVNKFDYKKVIFSEPCTIVIWADGTKTIVRCSPNEKYDPEKGLAIAFMKRALGDGNKHNKILRKETQKKIELIDEMHEHHHTTPKDVAATVGAIAKEMDDKLRETFGKKRAMEDEDVTATGAE